MINKIEVLEQYRDKSYINNILCQLSSEYYGKIKNTVSIPLILTSSVMTVLNASNIGQDELKYVNVILNSATALILALTNNFKIPEKQSLFRELAIKFNKLTHKIEDMLMYNIDDIIQEDIKDIITEYDNINESMIYPVPNYIKTKVKNSYKGKRTLPNILNCETTFATRNSSFNVKTTLPLNSSLDSSKNEIVNLNSSIVEYSKRTPVVLHIKPVENIEGLEESV